MTDAASEIIVEISRGAVDHRYVAVTGHRGFFPADAYGQPDSGASGANLTLHLEGVAEPVRTDITPKGFFRNRSAWAPFFKQQGIGAGDAIRIERVADYDYRLSPIKRAHQAPAPQDWRQNSVSRESVLAAIAEFDAGDRDHVLRAYGYGRARDYVVVCDGREYDSKALYGIAYSIEYPDEPPIKDRGFQGGPLPTSRLRDLGFEVRSLRDVRSEARPEARAWIIRAGADGENEDVARDEGVAVIGWSELGELPPDISRDEIKRRIRERTGEEREASLSAQGSSIHRFINDVSDGDVVVLPLLSHRRHAAVGIVTGPYVYRADGLWEDRDAHYHRAVRWLEREIPYERFDDDLQKAFGTPGTLSEILRPDAVQRLLRAVESARGQSTRVWWVCQGTTYASARDLGVLWAPKIAVDGSSRSFWRALEDANEGDLVLHYAHGSVRAVGNVVETVVDAARPKELEGDWIAGDGWLVRVDYGELDTPLELGEIPNDWRVAEGGPFTRNGSVQQGYFFPLSDRFVRQLAERFPRLGLPDSGDVVTSFTEPTLEVILQQLKDVGLRIPPRTLRRYHLSLKTRGFVVLAGISGGGKTWLAEAYAAAVGAEQLVVPVAPNWTTNEDLLGYLNPIDGEYRHTDFSRFLMRAAAEHADAKTAGRTPRPYHLILDEMNLARVEYYFAKFLSAMERRTRYGTAQIQLSDELEAQLTPNLMFIGTVNVDETTFGFADKVYDRAQLIELDAPRELLAAHISSEPYAVRVLNIWDALRDVAPFAFRVLDELAAYVAAAAAIEVDWPAAIDEQLLQKVLPKVKGTDPQIRPALEAFIEQCDGFPLSRAKAERMLATFKTHGFVSYF